MLAMKVKTDYVFQPHACDNMHLTKHSSMLFHNGLCKYIINLNYIITILHTAVCLVYCTFDLTWTKWWKCREWYCTDQFCSEGKTPPGCLLPPLPHYLLLRPCTVAYCLKVPCLSRLRHVTFMWKSEKSPTASDSIIRRLSKRLALLPSKRWPGGASRLRWPPAGSERFITTKGFPTLKVQPWGARCFSNHLVASTGCRCRSLPAENNTFRLRACQSEPRRRRRRRGVQWKWTGIVCNCFRDAEQK